MADTAAAQSPRRRLLIGAVLVAIYLAVVYLIPRPEAVKPEGWRLTGLFLATIAGLILQPIPGGALVLIAVAFAPLTGGLTINQALAGYGDATVWMVQAAFFISSAMIKTGLARRIALLFVRAVGTSSLGVAYALSFTDAVLATIIPSNGARSGGVTLPIARSIASLYGSEPGATSTRLGSFLMIGVYQGICVSAAMFYTGQASNPLAAKIAGDAFGYTMTWTSWITAAIVPGFISLLVAPWIAYRVNPPEVKRTPEAAEFAAREIVAMGPINRLQGIVLVVFAGVCGLWIATPWHGFDVAVPALLGACLLLLSGVLSWNDVISDRTAWDIFIWYGGLLRLGKALNDAGVTTEFAKAVGAWLGDASWPLLFAVALAVYFYAHYALASITAHILAMFMPFVAVLVAKDAPVGLVIFAFACFTNLSAGLTHYGTTPAPMFFATGYTPFKTWWTVGFLCSLANIAIWSTIGFAWWKLIGIW